jgi:hypothetical protein
MKANNITLMDTPETDEAELLFMKVKKLFRLLYSFILLFVIYFSIQLIIKFNNLNFYLFLISACILLFALAYGATVMKPYLKMIKIAKINDLERHKERVRFKEELRLKEIYAQDIKRIDNLIDSQTSDKKVKREDLTSEKIDKTIEILRKNDSNGNN